MGIDICGWIECRMSEDHAKFPGRKRISRQKIWTKYTWEAAINLHYLYRGRDYDAFACLFGVKNSIGFRPVAAKRGMPSDVSEVVQEDLARFDDSAHSHSWISWQEVKQIDWEEETEIAGRIQAYRRNTKGELVLIEDPFFVEYLRWQQDFNKRVGSKHMHSSREQEWDLGNVVYRTRRTKRKEIKGAWSATFQVMEALAFNYGEDGVRLVVWFA